MKKLIYITLAFITLLSVEGFSQANIVKGVVKSLENGELIGLPGAAVKIKGTSQGTATSIDGSYSLEAKPTDVLVFSYIGYRTQEILVGQQTVIDIELIVDLQQLEEVVVVGYGTLKKSEVTGSISSVKGEDIAEMKMPSFDQALQGSVAGVQVNTAGGVPGGPIKIQIRGTNSISSNTTPLFIIDGLPMSSVGGRGDDFNPMASINPDDIESVEVLKDAAATAIYGSRGANGVIIITTKTGKKGTSKTDFSFTTGISQSFNLPEFADSQLWWEVYDQARASENLSEITSDRLVVGQGSQFGFFSSQSDSLTRGQAESVNVDWLDPALRTGTFSEVNLSHSGASEKTNYFFSLNYRDEGSVYESSRFQRIAARANLNSKLNEFITGGLRLNNSMVLNDQPLIRDGFRRAVRSNLPWFPEISEKTGEFNDPLAGYNINYLLNDDFNFNKRETFRSISNALIDIKLPFYEAVHIKSEAGYDYRNVIRNSFESFFINPLGSTANQTTDTNYSLNYNIYATFNKTFGDHSFSAVVGTERNEFRQKRSTVTGTGENQRKDINEPGTVGTDNFKQDLAGTIDNNLFWGDFGRINYTLKDRYLFNYSFRRDASSKFPEGNEIGYFQAISGGYIVSEENFWNPDGLVHYLKLRASYGELGNNQLPNNLGQNQYVDWPNYGGNPGRVLTNIANESIAWETIVSTEFGVEFGLLANRISGEIAYYNLNTEDMLMPARVPSSFGAAPYSSNNSLWTNLGVMTNSGIEIELQTINFDNQDFKWSTSFNFTWNSSKMKTLSITDSVYQARNEILLIEGENLGMYYVPVYAGIDENGTELIYRVNDAGELTDDKIPLTGASVNANRYLDRDKTGQPTYWGGITNNFSYKNWALSIFLAFQGGNYLLDTWERDVSYINRGNNVILKDVADNRWESRFSGENSLPAPDWQGSSALLSDRFLHKGDYLKVRSVRLSYDLPQTVLDKIGLKRCQVYAIGNNLFTITSFNGLDPEVLRLSGGINVDAAVDYNLGQGIITNGSIAPQVRSYSFGVSLGF